MPKRVENACYLIVDVVVFFRKSLDLRWQASPLLFSPLAARAAAVAASRSSSTPWRPRRATGRRSCCGHSPSSLCSGLRGGEGNGRSSAASHHRCSRATAGDDEVPFPFPSHLVRLATREDLPALVAIERACGHFEWGAEALRHELESPLATLLVAEVKEEEGEGRSRFPSWTDESDDDGEDKENEERPGHSAAPSSPSSTSSSSPISGLAIVWTVADETQVLELAVHPARRRMGAARALLSAALASSAASSSSAPSSAGGRAVLEVASRNDAAISLYSSFGFEVDGVRKGYYRDGDDALLMSLRIGGSGEREEEEEEEGEPRRTRRRSDDSAPSSPPTPPG